jgi:predicted RNase H-related nuclease YkuK (DUF458 family)
MGYSNLDLEKRKFKKFGGEIIDDIVEYINDYIGDNKNIKVIVGTDSHNRRRVTTYVTCIALRDDIARDGAHVLFLRMKEKKEKVIFNRLMNETMYSLDLAEYLEENIKPSYQATFKRNKYDGSQPTKRVEIHVDLNPEEGDHNKSHQCFKSVMGMLCGSGYSVKSKNESYCASCAADLLCK